MVATTSVKDNTLTSHMGCKNIYRGVRVGLASPAIARSIYIDKIKKLAELVKNKKNCAYYFKHMVTIASDLTSNPPKVNRPPTKLQSPKALTFH